MLGTLKERSTTAQRLGLIACTRWESSALYDRSSTGDIAARLGARHSADCVPVPVDFVEIEAMQSSGSRGRQTAGPGAATRSDLRTGVLAFTLNILSGGHVQGCLVAHARERSCPALVLSRVCTIVSFCVARVRAT